MKDEISEEKVVELSNEWFRKNELMDVHTSISYVDPSDGKTIVVNLKARPISGNKKLQLHEKSMSVDGEGDANFNAVKYNDELVKLTFNLTDEQLDMIKENKPIGVYDALISSAMKINSMGLTKGKVESLKN
jgi:hypothetical protein